MAPATRSNAASDPRIESYIDAIYDRTAVRYSFTASTGQVIDCADFASEPGVRTLLAQGATVDGLLSAMKARQLAGHLSVDANSPSGEDIQPNHATEIAKNVEACPTLTVPHVRLTAERIAAAGGLDAYRAAFPHSLPSPPRAPSAPQNSGIPLTSATNPAPGGQYAGDTGVNADFGHVISYQGSPVVTSPIKGGLATMVIGPESIVTPAFVNSPANHSVAQIWISGGSGATTQTLEVGWEIDAQNGGPYLFIGATQDGYTDFCENGQQVKGTSCVTWIPNPTGTALYPGVNLPASVIGGVQHELTIQVTYWCPGDTTNQACQWGVEVAVDGAETSYLGYFATTGYGNGALATEAGDIFETGGEVNDESGTFSVVQMGEAGLLVGAAATPSYGQNAYVRNFGYYDTTWPLRGNAPLVETGATVYTTQSEFSYDLNGSPATSAWTNWYFYGDYLPPFINPVHLR